MTVYDRMLERYESGELPWHDALPPPEVIDLVATLPVGRALDLGCGPGRASIYMARLGWEVDGVDFIPKAIAMAKDAAVAAKVSPQFHIGSVTKLNFLTGTYDFALDVGCLHGQTEKDQRRYYQVLLPLLKSGARYLLFARIKDDDPATQEGPGIKESRLMQLFSGGFTLDKVEYGVTTNNDQTTWQSAWFWFTRN